MTLTNTAINALAKGKALNDPTVPGLSIRAHAGGKSWMLYYRPKKGQKSARRMKLGNYPTLPIAEAREIARANLLKVAQGKDPMTERREAVEEPTVDQLWERCALEHWNHDKGWDREAKRLYTTHVKPKLGKKKVAEITYDDCRDVHDRLRATPIEANRALAILSKMLSLAEKYGPENAKWRGLGANPCQHVTRFKEKNRKRYARPDELAKLGPVLEAKAEVDPQGVAFLYLLALSGARPSEIAKAEPAQLERVGPSGVLRIEGKTGARDVFLPPQAMAVIDKLPREGIDVIRREHEGFERKPSAKTITGLAGVPRKLWAEIRKEVGCPDLWARDLRRTFATVGLSNGVGLGQIGELLGHASTQTTKIYAKLVEDDAHRAAAEIAVKVAGLLNGGKNVPSDSSATDPG